MDSIALLLALFSVCCLLLSHGVNGSISCADVLTDTTLFQGNCTSTWSNLRSLLRPTQMQVGYAWIGYKLEKDFSSLSKAEETISGSTTPAVLGPEGKFYIVDDHHTLCALDYSGYSQVSLTVEVICDLRNVSDSEFWQYMFDNNLALPTSHPTDQPNVLPINISYPSIPSSFQFTKSMKSLSDDPWRSLAGYSRKVESDSCASGDKYCLRCFYRGCVNGYDSSGTGVPFFEFRWSYFMNYAVFYDNSYWPTQAESRSFYDSYLALPVSGDLSKVSTASWLAVAGQIIPLCRSDSTKAYELPQSLFHLIESSKSNSLPGYVEGNVKIANDPDCDSPTCLR